MLGCVIDSKRKAETDKAGVSAVQLKVPLQFMRARKFGRS